MKSRVLLFLAIASAAAGGGLLLVGGANQAPSADAPMQIAGELHRGAARIAGEGIVLTVGRESAIGREYLACLPVPPGSSRDADYVAVVLRALVVALGPTEYSFDAFLHPDTRPNAAALPGGRLYVTKGMLDLVRSEAELAAVLGHEIMHVQKGHWREALKARAALERTGLDEAAPVVQMVANILELGFSEAQELESDRAGVELAAAAGYAPRAAERLFERFRGLHSPGPPPARDPVGLTAELARGALIRFFETHPAEGQRIEAVRQAIRDRRSSWSPRRFYWGRKNLDRREPKSTVAAPEEWRALDDWVGD